MGEPFDQASLVHELDTTTAFARIEQLFFRCTLSPTYPTSIRLFEISFFAFGIGIVGRVVHEVREGSRPGGWAKTVS
jgi:hypothetical protein